MMQVACSDKDDHRGAHARTVTLGLPGGLQPLLVSLEAETRLRRSFRPGAFYSFQPTRFSEIKFKNSPSKFDLHPNQGTNPTSNKTHGSASGGSNVTDLRSLARE